MSDVEKAVKIFRKNKCKFSILHCGSNYPSEEKDLNLKLIPIYKRKFKVDIGYSGHERGVSPSIMAVCLGAKVIERHITLDRTMWGTDQAASLEKKGMIELISVIKKVNTCMGNGKKKFLPDERKKLKENKYW